MMPLQREKTALKRGALDNLYLHNNPRVEVEVAESNASPRRPDFGSRRSESCSL
jgi:hypothetical protein